MTTLHLSDSVWSVVIVENSFFLLAGFTLLILSGDKLVETSIRIARRWNVPQSVIAVTIIAAGTSAPEFVTSFLAGLRGSSDISIGNLIGSNSFNLLAVGGLSLILMPSQNSKDTWPSWITLILSSLLFFFALENLSISRAEAAFFIVALLSFIAFSFLREREKENTFENLESKSFARTLIFFTLSFMGLIFGAELALTGGVELGKIAGLSERIIAITIISVGTGLPELATSLSAAFRGHGDIALANVIGSNIFNTLAIPGGTASFFALSVNENFLNFDFYVMIGATIAIGLVYLTRNTLIIRTLGALMVLSYGFYTLFLLKS